MMNSANRAYKANITAYLAELSTLSNQTVSADDLSCMNEVENIRATISDLKKLPISKFNIPFPEKENARFRNYIHNLYESCSEKVYIWTSKTNSCGLYKIDNIDAVNFSFPFNLNTQGVVVFLSENIKNKLLLDFYIDSSGEKIIEVESQGLQWGAIKY